VLIRRALGFENGDKLVLATRPARHETVAQRPARVRRRPRVVAHDVEDARARRLAAVRLDQASLRPVGSQCLGAGAEPRAHQCTVRAEHQRCGEAPPVDDAARRDDRRGRDEIDDRRHQRHRAAAAAVSSAFGALRDDEIGFRFARQARLVEALHLADQLAAGRLDRGGVRARITEGQHERVGPMREGEIENARADGPRDEPDAPGPRRLRLRERQFARQPIAIAVAAADETQRARIRDGGGEPAARCAAHGGEHDRILQLEGFGQCGGDHRWRPVGKRWRAEILILVRIGPSVTNCAKRSL
jgi:hypothetical protein